MSVRGLSTALPAPYAGAKVKLFCGSCRAFVSQGEIRTDGLGVEWCGPRVRDVPAPGSTSPDRQHFTCRCGRPFTLTQRTQIRLLLGFGRVKPRVRLHRRSEWPEIGDAYRTIEIVADV